MAQGLPTDACPYARPFAVDFDDCPAYSPVRFLPTDTQGRVLSRGWTCAHLAIGIERAERSRFYARCRIGDAGKRRAWTLAVGEQRLGAWEEWRKLSGPVVEGAISELVRANAAAFPGGAAGRVAGTLEPTLTDFLAQIAALADRSPELFARLEFPRDAYLELVERWTRFVVGSGGQAEWRTPPDLIERFPVAAQPLVDVEHWAATYGGD